MDRLPEEVVLHIFSYCEVQDIVRLQTVSCRYLKLGRDNALWKIDCFSSSRAEALRRRQQLLTVQSPQLAELRNAVTALPGADLTAWDVAQLRGSTQPRSSADPEAEARVQRTRALVNWEPGYPDERLNYYEEYIHRHASINVHWVGVPQLRASDKDGVVCEATGTGTLDNADGSVQTLVSPLDDGSICVWDISERSSSHQGGRGRLIHQTRPGLLTGREADATSESRAIMTEVGAVECVSIDSTSSKGYFAVQNSLHEIDLNTMQAASTKQYPFPITVLSDAKDRVPVTVGTNWTVHLHDPRDRAFMLSGPNPAGELIGGSQYSHATLAQPGPLSILHDSGLGADDSSIWVAGRFTSLLNYDRRFFPRLRGTIHSGARIASLSSLPYPLVPQNLDLIRNPEATISALVEARNRRGTTILAAAEYKGKGSLELYGLPRVQPYQNRQTASASKLLSVAPHGGRIVFSDGDGNLKWVERDGFSHVRTLNINDTAPIGDGGSGQPGDASAYGIWSSTASEMPGQGDIVQKIISTHPITNSTLSYDHRSSRADINQSNLILWTGDGRLGMLGFGHRNALDHDENEVVEVQAESAEQRAKQDAERQYGMAMRRALERNADEVRFVRGLGMGFARH
ncbi:hypothetical protein BAUCODRAFT_377634 [Baudoinia panamericana UAMH 10762]|uniref:F-box domain-containing protein n=1 Tax=Baudoinia panamericana (strain UAMH 10762) TaxID=717646 RepID=M2MPK2_BAUPA|nr:uncharacterized protein BAUCODRAFT_377634 [Baudoinia panamericana UAMH 10762]EMC98676.1 hypothetical protein BAUCODRAFT_377634 [Baudoinia panamericana UAMH 10762]